MTCEICGCEATSKWKSHTLCDKCMIKVLVNTVALFEEWSPADAADLVASVMIEHTDQAASLRRLAKGAV